jgi:hypothetical protein
LSISTARQSPSEHLPEVGDLVRARSRKWLVEEVVRPEQPRQSPIVRLACADDDAQGQSLDVFWDYELDRPVIEEEGWQHLAAKGFDPPRHFAAFLHTLRWNCVTATDPNLFQAPFRAGIKIGALAAADSCSAYHFPPWERVSAEIKGNVQPLPDDFSRFFPIHFEKGNNRGPTKIEIPL